MKLFVSDSGRTTLKEYNDQDRLQVKQGYMVVHNGVVMDTTQSIGTLFRDGDMIDMIPTRPGGLLGALVAPGIDLLE